MPESHPELNREKGERFESQPSPLESPVIEDAEPTEFSQDSADVQETGLTTETPNDPETIGRIALSENAAQETFVTPGKTANTQTGKARTQKKPNDEQPEDLAEVPVKPRGGRGHYKKVLRTNLAQTGKLNSKKKMSPEQKRLRRRKRKR